MSAVTSAITQFTYMLNQIKYFKPNLLCDTKNTNPLLWEIGHVLYFCELHCLVRSGVKSIMNGDPYIYDSYLCDRKYRFENLISFKELLKYSKYILPRILQCEDTYLKNLVSLHIHMHIESFYFTLKRQNLILEHIPGQSIEDDGHINFITMVGDTYVQGSDGSGFTWDNEKPAFRTQVETFGMSKHCVTNKMYKKFIKRKGYLEQKYWCKNGWRWVKEKNIKSPQYWKLHKHLDDYPVCHVSYYEAMAFCNWYTEYTNDGNLYRLPFETEWEYACKRIGNKDYANLDYSGGICSVYDHDGIQMYGNVWEWCIDDYAPYDGFTIDPVYREFSYPFFGYRKICRGGSWCCPKELITSYYRNAQMPDNQNQYTGFRIIKV